MATPRDKFIELRKSGVDAKTARTQAYGDISPTPITNAPVAGVSPVVTPPTPTNPQDIVKQYNQNKLQENKSKVQSEIQAGTRPAVGTQATPAQTPEIIQQAQTQTEQANTPVTTTIPVTPNNPVTNNVTPSVATETTKAQPTPEQTPQTAVAPVTPKEQKVTAPVTTITPPNPRDIAVSNKLNQYSAMSSQQFVDLMKQGQIPSSISSQLATTNPQFQQAQQEYSQFLKTNNINTSGKAVYNAMTGGQTEQAVNPLEAISNSLLKAFGVEGTQPSYLDAFKESIAQNDAIKTKTLELNAKQAEIDQKVQARDNILKDYKKQYNGVPLSTLIAMAARDAQPINDEITTLQRDVAQLSSDLKFETELAKGEYDAKVKDMEAKTGIRNTILGNLMNAQFGLATKQMEAQMAEQIAKQAFNDPMKAIPAMIDEYKKLGIPFERSTQEIVADFQASGQDLASYLTDLQKTVQSKPEYKRIQEIKAGELSDVQKMKLQAQISEKADIRNFAQQIQIAQMQGDITRANYLWQIQNDPEKQAKLLDLQEKVNANKSLYDMLGVNVGTYEGNRGYDLAGKKGDPVPAGGNWKVESIIDANVTSSPYGNSVVMVDENGNKVRYSHLESIGVKPGDTLGFGEIVGTRGNTGNVRGKNGEVLTAEQIKAGRGSHVDVEIKDSNGRLLSQSEQINYLKGKKPAIQFDANALSIANGVGDLSDLTPTDKKTILPQLEQIINSRMTGDSGRDSVVKSALYKKDVSDSTLQKMTDMQTVAFQLDSIQERLANQKVGPILGQIKKLNPYDTEAQVALAELAGITPKVARGIFGEVGVLTDTDIANYQKTLPNLTSTEEKNAFVVEVMKKLLAKGVINTIETQARGQRNMSPFLDVYDKAKSSLNVSPTSKYE